MLSDAAQMSACLYEQTGGKFVTNQNTSCDSSNSAAHENEQNLVHVPTTVSKDDGGGGGVQKFPAFIPVHFQHDEDTTTERQREHLYGLDHLDHLRTD
jgi:hypothetical protein